MNTSARLWKSSDPARYFLIPDASGLPKGEFLVRTATGCMISVDAASVAAFEVSAEKAQSWAKEQLAGTLGQLRGNALDFIERLQSHTETLRSTNRRQWEDGIANASPELRPTLELVRTGLQSLGQTLQRMAHKHSGSSAPDDRDKNQ